MESPPTILNYHTPTPRPPWPGWGCFSALLGATLLPASLPLVISSHEYGWCCFIPPAMVAGAMLGYTIGAILTRLIRLFKP